MEDKILVYVAGNPQAYPIEYYDAQAKTYRGIVPELFAKFTENSPYEIVYYRPGTKDERAHLAQQHQVDLVTGFLEDGEAPEETQTATVFHAVQDGREISYQLFFTDSAPESLKADLTAFLQSVSQETVTGMLVSAAEPPRSTAGFYWGIGALSLAIVLLVTAIVLVVRRYRMRLKKALQDLETDSTTGLGNFDYLERYYKQLISDGNRILYQLVYFYVDTDRLRRITSGEETDEFLVYCAMVLQEYAADTDILAKVTERGFVLLRLSSNLQKLDEWIEPIIFRVRSYTQLYSKPFEVDMTAGIYPLKAGDRELDEMIFSASQAAYLAAQKHVDYEICTDRMLQQIAEEKQLQIDMEMAFERDEFQLYLQFYVNAFSFQLVGGEALSRWNHPQKGVLTPSRFIPLMEREKMISRLDYCSLQKVCRFLQTLYEKGIETFFISCNFSRATFGTPDFVERCREIVDTCKFPRELLIFEITESASASNAAQIKKNMNDLKAYGVRIALDDFGEGFTSFFDLHEYPIDGIKLDKSLVDNSVTESGASILKAMIRVGHELGVTILAEGVETDEQVATLQRLGCDVIQGYRFSFPVPDWEAEEKVTAHYLQDSTTER